MNGAKEKVRKDKKSKSHNEFVFKERPNDLSSKAIPDDGQDGIAARPIL